MKTSNGTFASIVPVIAALVLTSAASAQHVTKLEVRKDGEQEQRTTVEIRVPMDFEGLDFENPIDFERTDLAQFSDDQGLDLLQLHEEEQAKLREQGYEPQPRLSFGGVADYAANKDLSVLVAVATAPSSDARTLNLKGTAVFNFAGDGEPETVEVADVPVEMSYDSEGFASDIGPILIRGDGSAEMDGVTYNKFSVSGREIAIVQAKPLGGDDSAEVEFWAVDNNQFVFKEVPETVTLEIQYAPIRKVPVEFDLEFSVGL